MGDFEWTEGGRNGNLRDQAGGHTEGESAEGPAGGPIG